MACALIPRSASVFFPQVDREILGPEYNSTTEYFDPPSRPLNPDHSRFHYCNDCEVTWLEGDEGPTAASDHPTHDTLYFEDTDKSRRTLIVHIDGACPGNGVTPIQSSIGVYFGPQSSHNTSRLLNNPNPTNQSAELTAAIYAIQRVRNTVRPRREQIVGQRYATASADRLRDTEQFRLVVATDSSYVVECMCEHIHNWSFDPRTGTYANGNGEIRKNSALFFTLVTEVHLLSEVGVRVQWYHISRRFNKEADGLAKRALTPRH